MYGTESRQDLEAVGHSYSEEAALDVRRRTRRVVWEIGTKVQCGMADAEAREVAAGVLRDAGLRKGWHKVLVRCGSNTTKNFEEPSVAGVRLAENDIFFVDVGPIFEGTEGDAGETFVLGSDPDMLRAKHDVQALWRAVRAHWHSTNSTGAELYDFAARTARSMGWVLNLELTGHRLAEFPHEAHYDGTLAAVGFRPSSNLWVLEIQIRHPSREFGAFFEDLLLVDDDLQQLSYGPPL